MSRLYYPCSHSNAPPSYSDSTVLKIYCQILRKCCNLAVFVQGDRDVFMRGDRDVILREDRVFQCEGAQYYRLQSKHCTKIQYRYVFVSVSTSCLTMLFLGLSENSGLLFDLIFTKNISEVTNIPFCYFLSYDWKYRQF